MIIGSSLPNDLLRNLPPLWDKTIPTWPINDALLAATGEAERLLEELGYYLKFGIEVNVNALSITEANEFRKNNDRRTVAWRQAARGQFMQSLTSARGAPPSLDAYAGLYSKLEEIIRQRLQTSAGNTQELLDDWQLIQSFYQRARWQNGTVEADLASKDFLIAALHYLPQHEGGLQGLIEHRFASAEFGTGWWDGGKTIELRTHPGRGHESAIANYHQSLWRLKDALEYGGLVPAVYSGVAQAHFSLWRIKDDVNILNLKNDESLTLQTRFAGAIRDILLTQPIEYPSVGMENEELIDAGVPFVGSSRMSIVRICKGGHWELRLPHGRHGLTHLARDLYIITEAARRFVQPEHPSAKHIREQLEHAQREIDKHVPGVGVIVSTKDLIDPFCSKLSPIRRVNKIAIAANPPRISCPFVSCLEAAVIDEQGNIDVPPGNFLWNGHLMLDEIGADAAKIFGVEHRSEIRAEAWQTVFKKLVITDNHEIDASALHPDIGRHFNGLSVSDYYTDIHGGELTTTQIRTRTHVNALMAKWIAQGKYQPVPGEETTAAQREVLNFIQNRRFTFDPEDALPYLIHLFNRCAAFAANNEGAEEATAEIAVNIMLEDVLGQWVRKKAAYAEVLASRVEYIEEHEILRLMLSLRESVLTAIPDAVKFHPPLTERFFAYIDHILSHPEILYGPNFIGGILRGISLNSPDAFIDVTGSKAVPGESKQEHLSSVGLKIGRTAIRLVAAAQLDETRTTDILRQYAEHSGSLTRPSGQFEGPRMPGMLVLEDGMQRGAIGEAQKLLGDLSPLSRIRERALEGLIV